MGNSQTKEARSPTSTSSVRGNVASSPHGRTESLPDNSDSSLRPPYSSRPRRSSRPDLSFLGLGGSGDQDVASLEARRESKQEREARRLEKERVTRIKERERSMKEEHVDGGYMVTQGVYVGLEDYNKVIVRQLMIERRLAPFWKGLNDFSESWAEHQLMAAARGLPIPPADEVPPELEYRLSKRASLEGQQSKDKSSKSLTIPINSRSQSYHSDVSAHHSPNNAAFPAPSPSQATSTSPLFRTRAKTLATLTTSSRSNSPADMTPRENQLPVDPFVNGQPIEAYLYKDASECPICFLYYPPYLNTTRCCDQPICSECFVQIKRPDPHQPEHEQPDANAPPPSEAEREAQSEGLLVSEVATCPYCKQPEFGITYVPPPFRRGLTYTSSSNSYQVMSAMSSQTSLSSSGMSPGPGRRRGTSLSANAPEVITTDKIRPDWATKLATARAHAARRSAAATALHTAAYLMNGQQDSRPFGPFARRIRRPTLDGMDAGLNPHLSALAMLAERHTVRQQETGPEPSGNPFLPPPRGSSSRRSRMDDLEDMMMMEAIRLSLASEEERRRKEEKDAKKEEKKKAKESKKAEKAARKNSLFTLNSNTSTGENGLERTESATSSNAGGDQRDPTSSGDLKGKAAERSESLPDEVTSHDEVTPKPSTSFQGTSMLSTSQESLASSFPPLGSEPFRRSHLRQMSNVSSSASSFVEGGSGQSFPGSSTPPGGGAGLEPMFNFRSLAAMIGEEDGKAVESSHVEHADEAGRARSFEEVNDQPGSAHLPSSSGSIKGHLEGKEHANGSAKQNGEIKAALAASSHLASPSSTSES